MIPGKYSYLVTCIAAAGMGMFVAVWLLDFVIIRANWCAGVETACFREWISATSGWIAAMIAAITATIILKQIRTAENHHKDSLARLELPERNTANQARRVIKKMIGVATMIHGYRSNVHEKEDIYAIKGEEHLFGFKQILLLITDPVFVRLQSMDTRLIAYYHKVTREELDLAISSCEVGIIRKREQTLPDSENQRRTEFFQSTNLLYRVMQLQQAVDEAVQDRFPDLKS